MTPNDESISSLIQVCDQLHRAASQSDPTSPVTLRLKAALSPDTPDPIRMREVVDEFYSLPESDQRRLLAGWRPNQERPDRAAVERNAVCGDVLRVLEIEARPDGWTRADQRYVLEGSSAPVVIRIAEGTSKTNAARALTHALTLIVGDFTELVGRVPDATDFQSPIIPDLR